MDWIKFLKAYDSHTVNEIVSIDSAEAKFLIKAGIAEKTEKPAEAQQIDSELSKTADTLVDTIVMRVEKTLSERLAKAGNGKRPVNISTHDNELDDPKGGFKNYGEFTLSVMRACQGQGQDERLLRRLKANGASENVAADGGYATPTEFAETIFNDVTSPNNLMSQCTLVPMNSNSIKLPAINYTTQGSFGVQAYWEGEGQAAPTSKVQLRQPQLNLNKLFVLAPLTSELIEDGVGILGLTTQMAANAITYQLNQAILFGKGGMQPIGIVGHGSTVALTRTTNNLVITADVISMQSALMSVATNPVWIINKGTVEPQLLTLQDAGGRYLYFAPGTFADNPNQGKLLGKPVLPIENAAALGSHGDILLTDLKGYVIGYKTAGVQQAMSIHLYFNTDEVAYRWTLRVDGRPWRDTTLAAANGSGTYGFAVTL